MQPQANADVKLEHLIWSHRRFGEFYIPHGVVLRPALSMEKQDVRIFDTRTHFHVDPHHNVQVLCRDPRFSTPIGFRAVLGRYYPEGTSDDRRYSSNFVTFDDMKKWVDESTNPVDSLNNLTSCLYVGDSEVGGKVIVDALASLARDAALLKAGRAVTKGTQYSVQSNGIHEVLLEVVLYK